MRMARGLNVFLCIIITRVRDKKIFRKVPIVLISLCVSAGLPLIVKETTGCKSRAQVHDEIIREFGISDKKRPILGLFLLLVSKSTAKGGFYERAF